MDIGTLARNDKALDVALRSYIHRAADEAGIAQINIARDCWGDDIAFIVRHRLRTRRQSNGGPAGNVAIESELKNTGFVRYNITLRR